MEQGWRQEVVLQAQRVGGARQLAAALFWASAFPALAQPAPPEPADIIVTAQKREQSLLEVPVSLSIFNAEDLERQRINSFADLAVRTPNVAFSNLGDRSQTRIAIRGVGPIATGGTANLVGIFIDEFNIAPNVSTRTSDPTLFDAERIEILKGPQGTFFGRNVVGGAVSITTIKPDPERLAVQGLLTAASWKSWDVRGAVNVPLAGTAAIRVNGHYDRSDGWLVNEGPFGRGNESENYGGRAALRWQPSARITIDLQGSISQQNSELPSFVPTGFTAVSLDLLNAFRAAVPGTPRFPIQPNGAFPANSRVMNTDIGLPARNRTSIVTGRIEAEVSDRIIVTNVTGWISNRFRSSGEGDFTPNPSFTIRRDEDMTAISSETRIAGSTGRFDWSAGVLVARDTNDIGQDSVHLASDPFLLLYDIAFSVLGGPVCPPAITGLPVNIPGPCPGFAPFRLGRDTSAGFFENVAFGFRTDSVAVFGNLAWRPTDTLTIELGGRYASDRLRGSRTEGPLMVGLAPRPSVPTQSIRFEDFSPRAAVVFRPTTVVSFYAVASRGYRTGGFNLSPGDDPFESESLWNYEVGARYAGADGRFRGNLSLFQMNWDNTQVRAQDPITQRQLILNAEGSRHRGLELDFALNPVPWLEVGGAYGYLDARFRDFANARDLDGNPLDATGFPVPRAPEHSISAYGQAGFPVAPNLLLFGRVEYQFMDSFREDVSLNDRRLNPSYTLVNLRAGLEAERWSLTVFVENLGDARYRYGTSNLETFLSGAQASIGPTRRFGATAAVRY
ncbi:MAG: TonB-dependent receptor [Sphingomonadaceae bacterium]